MTKTETNPQPSSNLRNGLISIFIGIALLFTVSYLAGYTVGALSNQELILSDFGMIAGLLLAIIGMSFILWKLWQSRRQERVAASTLKARNWLYVAFAIGVVLGGFLAVAGGADINALFSNQPITPLMAAASIAIWLIAVPLITLAWWRSVDEHEATAYRDGAMVAAHAYLFIAPSWWLAARAGWIQAQDPMIVLLIVSIIWSAYWLYRKYT